MKSHNFWRPWVLGIKRHPFLNFNLGTQLLLNLEVVETQQLFCSTIVTFETIFDHKIQIHQMIKEVVQFVFQGAKFFWKTRNTMDVTIVYHEHHNVTEVIMFDISLGKEAPRIYINTEALESNVEQNEIEVLQNFATMNNVPISDKFLVGIANKAKADYILKRLVITEYSLEARLVVVSLHSELKGLNCRCVPPDATLVPYKTGYHQRLM